MLRHDDKTPWNKNITIQQLQEFLLVKALLFQISTSILYPVAPRPFLPVSPGNLILIPP